MLTLSATTPTTPPPRPRVGGGRRLSGWYTALFGMFFFSYFMAIEEIDAAAVVQTEYTQPLMQTVHFATPPPQGLVVSQFDDDALATGHYEDPGPAGSMDVDFQQELFRICALGTLRDDVPADFAALCSHVGALLPPAEATVSISSDCI
ncbi:hypothetical protein CYMTET_11483 [Cymbomonas tetramitiformis]|uniref:Uncharacterized protein n=1 Tax=Cymbomonas tetramitiformis TaxID=36881 RepID=A0AAE0GMK7_9CHLO|nr:hypothetical protein CYMTET_11483 [Cymbomonas tetramitiformis]